tara:strand:+ start:157 stop:345 length:189 start_codon:yes stop_codon:yes gene_type:complete
MIIDDECKKDIFDYIRRFRDKGEYNVLQVRPFLEDDFELDCWTARDLIIEYMQNPNWGADNG